MIWVLVLSMAAGLLLQCAAILVIFLLQDNGLIRSKLAGGLIILSGFVSAWVGSECVHYFNAVMGW